jgi:hypothetical protein
VFWQWGGSRPLVLSLAFALVVFGLSCGLPLAVSRATASASGSPRIDVVECANCPFYFFDTMTIFPSVINTVIWTMGLILALRNKIRPSGTLLVVFMLMFHLVGIGSGAAIAASLLPDGICVACVVHIMFVYQTIYIFCSQKNHQHYIDILFFFLLYLRLQLCAILVFFLGLQSRKLLTKRPLFSMLP